MPRINENSQVSEDKKPEVKENVILVTENQLINSKLDAILQLLQQLKP
jgi:hypothetical protein